MVLTTTKKKKKNCRNNPRPFKSIRHSKPSHAHTQITQHQHPQHNTQIHSKLHKGTQTVHTLQQLQIYTQEHENRSPTGRGTLTNTLHYIHCRPPDTNITKYHNSNLRR